MTPIEDQLRSIVLEALKVELKRRRSPSLRYELHHLFGDIGKIAKASGLKKRDGINAWREENNSSYPTVNDNLKGPIRDVIWDLICEGIVRPGNALHINDHTLPYCHVTEYGKRALTESVTPYDPAGYVDEIRRQVPMVDPIIEKYVAESARTLQFDCPLSSTVMLGCASEKAFLLLLDGYRAALNPTNRTKLDAELKGKWQAKRKHTIFMNWYETHLKPLLKGDPHFRGDPLTTLETVLRYLLDHFRGVRNRAGHPTGHVLPRQVVHGHLVLFPPYLRSIYDLIEWLDIRKGTL